MKFQRQAKILDLIDRFEIETQEDLTAHLRALGYNTTQATISRDIRELQIAKMTTGRGTYRYVLPKHADPSPAVNFSAALIDSIINVQYAQNLVVLKTIEGMAQGAAFALDNMGDTDIVGTLAGDDTILLVFHDNVRALDFCEQVKQMLR